MTVLEVNIKQIIVIGLALTLNAFAQERYLVSPNNELIPLRSGESASTVIEKFTSTSSFINAESGVIFGHPPDIYNPRIYLAANQRDVVGQWYVAKAYGTIDTVFWWGGTINQAKDSLVFLRIHRSIVGPDYGPGIGMYAGAPPCQSWGYWKNSLDLDMGIAAFPDDATDTTWYSTIDTQGGTIPSTRPPFGYSLWGALGYGKISRPGINFVRMLDAEQPCSVKIGDKFFISLRTNSGVWKYDWAPAEYGAWQSLVPVSTNDENWPPRVWKFYEHDSGPSSCGVYPPESIKRGWVARGSFIDDPAYTSALNIWFSMTVTTNSPPRIATLPGGEAGNTYSTSPLTVSCEITDTDPVDPESAYVQSAHIEWWKAPISDESSYVRQPDIAMSNTGPGDIWSGIIPDQKPGIVINYQIKAVDAKGMTAEGKEKRYKILAEKCYFWIDTSTICYNHEMGAVTTEIPYTDFFLPSDALPGADARDDGTAGPFYIGAGVPFLSDTMSFLWIGINGAIALTDNPEDTVHLNAGGRYCADWDLPYNNILTQYSSNKELAYPSPLPKNLIAPFWTDLILADTGGSPETYGHIRFGAGADTNLIIIEWDSIGVKTGGYLSEEEISFRIILNKFDGSIQYQYENVGTHGADTSALIGLYRGEEYPEGKKYGYVFVNKNGSPVETRPRNNWYVTLWPGAPIYVEAGWQLLSFAYNRGTGARITDPVYPGNHSEIFNYKNGYVPDPKLYNGLGHFVKFFERAYAGAPGLPIYDTVYDVWTGWNIIGTISKPVSVSTIGKNPPGMILSEFFGYDEEYYLTSILLPGVGYWVKSDQAGGLHFDYGADALPKQYDLYQNLNKIIVSDRNGNKQTLYLVDDRKAKEHSIYQGELPPAMPEFDARFTNSGGMVAVYPEKINESIEYPLTVSTENLPLTIQWLMTDPPEQTPSVTQNNRIICRLVNEGTIQIPTTEKLAITLRDVAGLPTEFALHQNFPNPFNPVTKIRYELPSAVHVQLKIFSLLGQEVVTLINDNIEAGYHEAEWDASNIAGGVYFIKFSAGDYTKLRKMLLIK